MSEVLIQQRCGHCGKLINAYAPASILRAQKRDLDGRPIENARFRLKEQISYCEECHYVSFDITSNCLSDDYLLNSSEYLEIVNNKSLPTYVNSAIALGYVYENLGASREASLCYQIAAWHLESLNRAKETEVLLEKVVLINLRVINSPIFKRSPDLNFLLVTIDVLRKIKKFDSAKKLVEYTKSKTSNRTLFKALLLEESLCDNYISAPHEISAELNSKYTNFAPIAALIKENGGVGDELKLSIYNEITRYLDDAETYSCGKGVDVTVLSSEKFSAVCDNFDLIGFVEDVKAAYRRASGEDKPKTVKPNIDSAVTNAINEEPTQKRVEVITSVSQLKREECQSTCEEGKAPEQYVDSQPLDEEANEKETDNFITDTSCQDQETEETVKGDVNTDKEDELGEAVAYDALLGEDGDALLENNNDVSAEDQPAYIGEPNEDADFSEESELTEEDNKEKNSIEETESEQIVDNHDVDLSTEETEQQAAIQSEKSSGLEEETFQKDIELPDDAVIHKDIGDSEEARQEDTDVSEEAEPQENGQQGEDCDFENIEEDNNGYNFGNGMTTTIEEESSEEDAEAAELANTAPKISEQELEQNLELLMTVAKIEGKISISEVQALFDYGYVQAKGLLDELQRKGVLSQDDDETYLVN